MPSQDDIDHQLKLLQIHRRNLDQYLKQQALHGAALVPPMITNGILEERENIRRVKAILRGWNRDVENLPTDEESPAATPPATTSNAPQTLTPPADPAASQTKSKPRRQSSARRKTSGAGDQPYDVFISYHEADEDWVRDELLPYLEGVGLKVLVEYRDFDVGVPHLDNIERAVDNSRHTLIVMTPDWLDDEWEEFQGLLTSTADPVGRRRKLIPLKLKPCQPPARIAMLNCADFTKPARRETEFQRLVHALEDRFEAGTSGPQSRVHTPPQAQNPMPAPKASAAVVSAPTPADSAAVDFLIIAPLTEERNAILRKLPSPRRLPPTEEDFRIYYAADLPTTFSDGATGTYRIIVTSPSGMGRVQAASVTGDALNRWHPRHIILVGIAGGAPAKDDRPTAERGDQSEGATGGVAAKGVCLGDVLIAEYIIDYELQKQTPDRIDIRWRPFDIDQRLLPAAQNFDDRWRSLIAEARPDAGEPRAHFGPIASGDKVIAYSKALNVIREVWSRLIGVEMEAGGAALAASQAARKPGFFMVRGVSDLADEQKGSNVVEEWRPYACDVAAAYTIALLQSGPVPLSPTIEGDLCSTGRRHPS